MSKCSVERKSTQLDKLVAQWKKSGYMSVEKDLSDALESISKDTLACHSRRVGGFSSILGDLELYKYRQKDSSHKEGARGGWRILGIFDPSTGTLYPIIIYPKKEWKDASDDTVTACVNEIVVALK